MRDGSPNPTDAITPIARGGTTSVNWFNSATQSLKRATSDWPTDKSLCAAMRLPHASPCDCSNRRGGKVPDDPEVLTRLGFLYQARGNADLALSYYQRAFTVDQDRAVVANNLGVFYARRGMLARSVELWRRIIRRTTRISVRLA